MDKNTIKEWVQEYAGKPEKAADYYKNAVNFTLAGLGKKHIYKFVYHSIWKNLNGKMDEEKLVDLLSHVKVGLTNG